MRPNGGYLSPDVFFNYRADFGIEDVWLNHSIVISVYHLKRQQRTLHLLNDAGNYQSNRWHGTSAMQVSTSRPCWTTV
eukprot:scaffold551214_cov20-Prasinocladus_malaysianus.AAC.1